MIFISAMPHARTHTHTYLDFVRLEHVDLSMSCTAASSKSESARACLSDVLT